MGRMDSLKIEVIQGEGTPDHGPDCLCVICPHCGAPEVEDCRVLPKDYKFNIKALRVHDGVAWSSHCLRCDKWFYN